MNSPSPGWVALVATPIGNLEDITLRALRTLEEADTIAAEDTRRARRLLAHHQIKTRVTPYHAFNEHRKTEQLLERVAGGERIAVLTDAGTPTLSDPGFLLVRTARQIGIEPVIIPGVSALTFAVTAAGMPVDQFMFAGFPPRKAGRRRNFLRQLPVAELTCFLYESPHRIPRLLDEIAAMIGPTTPVTLIREATKLHEQIIRGSAAELAEQFAGQQCKGEFTVVIGRHQPETDAANENHVET